MKQRQLFAATLMASSRRSSCCASAFPCAPVMPTHSIATNAPRHTPDRLMPLHSLDQVVRRRSADRPVMPGVPNAQTSRAVASPVTHNWSSAMEMPVLACGSQPNRKLLDHVSALVVPNLAAGEKTRGHKEYDTRGWLA